MNKNLLKAAGKLLILVIAAGFVLSCKGGDKQAAQTGPQKYKIALSNSYMGNDWRQEMLKTVEVAATKSPYAEEVDLTIVNCENTPEAQTMAIDAMIEQGYDAIIIDASSPTSLNPVIDRAIAAGIKVVSFDNIVNHPQVPGVYTDQVSTGIGWAKFIAAQLKPGDTVAIDTGLPGSTIGNTVYESAKKVFDEAGIKIVAEFASEWSDGVGQQQIASVLAANPGLNGLLCQAFGETIDAAFTQAGRKIIPSSGYHTNAGQLSALNKKMPWISANNPPGNSVYAMDVALRLLKGEQVPHEIVVVPEFFTIPEFKDIDIGYKVTSIEKGVTAFDDVPGALAWPAMPPEFTRVKLDISEVANFRR